MSNSISGAAGPQTTYTGQTQPAPKKTVADKEAFMQLLVAQVKNQNPLEPTDGVQFLTQLAQFSELEQMIEIRTELSQIREQLATDKQQTGEPTNV